MPRSPTEAKTAWLPQAASPWSKVWVFSPLFGAWAAFAYVLASLPILAMHHFDPATFIVAGSRYINAAATSPPIPVKANSDGYDGQFYYRMAARPFSRNTVDNGIVFDHPQKRNGRVLYSLIARLAAFGQTRLLPWSMFLVNIAGIAAIGSGAAVLARRLALPKAAILAIALWPGLFVTLTHDTTEIVATAFLIWSIAAFTARLRFTYAVLAAAATLARETTVPFLLGLLFWEAWRSARSASRAASFMRLMPLALALVPFALWRAYVSASWAGAPNPQSIAHDIGPPFLGVARMLADCLTGARPWASTPFKDAIVRGIVLATAPVILLFCGRVAFSLPRAFRRPDLAPLAFAWALTACLMSLLTANGPWIDPIAYFRAFSECFVLGCLVLFAGARPPRMRLVAALGIAECTLTWLLCLSQLRAA